MFMQFVLFIGFCSEAFSATIKTEICHYLRGTCDLTCEFEYVHKWGLSLCSNSATKCCAPDDVVQLMKMREKTTTTSTTTTTTTVPTLPLYDLPMSDSGFLSNTIPSGRNCGKPFFSHRSKRVVGGTVAPRGAWPWQVSFRYMSGVYGCGGSLISNRWVLTAAHCFKGKYDNVRKWRVSVGMHNLRGNEKTKKDLPIRRIIKHPLYRAYSEEDERKSNVSTPLHKRYAHDIALVELDDIVDIESKYVRQICLPAIGDPIFNNEVYKREQEYINDRFSDIPEEESVRSRSRRDDNTVDLFDVERKGQCWVTGWGSTGTYDDKENTLLRQVKGDVVSSSKCKQFWQTDLDDDTLCFGDGTHGPCKGDSGSPMSCSYQGKYYLVGVVSWGSEDCKQKGYPSVFTRVTSYLNWIEKYVHG